MKLHHFGFMFFACAFLAVGAFLTYPGGELLTSPAGYAVNFRIEVYQDNKLVRTCECWRYEENADNLQPYAEHDLKLAPIWYEWGQAREITGAK
jgi:hypothetical protein